MSWERAERTLTQLTASLLTAETEEQLQAVGMLGRDALISMAQAVFRPEEHWVSDDPRPSSTDAKRQLEAYLAFALAGSSREQTRAVARSSVQLADALTHKRTATKKDAQLVALTVKFVFEIINILEERTAAADDDAWQGVVVGDRYVAWDGRRLHALEDRTPIPTTIEMLNAIKASGHTPSFGVHAKLREHLAKGRKQAFETHRRSWRRELLYADDGSQVLLVRSNDEPPSVGVAVGTADVIAGVLDADDDTSVFRELSKHGGRPHGYCTWQRVGTPGKGLIRRSVANMTKS